MGKQTYSLNTPEEIKRIKELNKREKELKKRLKQLQSIANGNK